MNILSIETSCDDTSFAITDWNQKKSLLNFSAKIIENLVSSQTEVHKKYGGVVPDLSAREHLKNFPSLLKDTLNNAGISLSEIDCFSVASGPGLIPSLLVGANIAKTLAYYYNKPLVNVHHIEGHIYSTWIKKNNQIRNDVSFPALALIVSGGHTQLIYIPKNLKYFLIGQTLDDACGEAYDKVAKMLELEYPGGPIVSRLSSKGDPEKFDFPRPLINRDTFDFSFSGLKTAVLYKIQNLSRNNKSLPISDICASFEKAVFDTLIHKTNRAVLKYKPRTLILAGGVASNKKLRKLFKEKFISKKMKVQIPPFDYTCDNAAMQGPVVIFKLIKYGKEKFQDGWKTVQPSPNPNLFQINNLKNKENKCVE